MWKALLIRRACAVSYSFSFAKGQNLWSASTGKIPEHFRNVKQRTGLDFFHIIPVSAIPGLGLRRDISWISHQIIDFGDFMFPE